VQGSPSCFSLKQWHGSVVLRQRPEGAAQYMPAWHSASPVMEQLPPWAIAATHTVPMHAPLAQDSGVSHGAPMLFCDVQVEEAVSQ
jgi:hypothetical protein